MTRKGVILVGILVLATGCSAGRAPAPISTLTIAPPNNPYQSKSSTPDIPTATVPIPTEQPLIPTATPFKHAVQPGDTLYGIALNYNISLDKLVLANPGVDTSVLSIGTELVIPFSDENDLAVPTPTPYPIPLSDPYCYPTRDGGMWCFLMVENDQKIVLENISAAFNLYSADKELTQSIIAIPPLNLLFPKQSIVLTAFIPEALPDEGQVSGILLTSLRSEQTEPQTEISDYTIQYSQENRIAIIRGEFKILNPESKGDQVWIAAIAFNKGIPVGVRKWVSTDELSPGTAYPFEINLYSLGPRIDQIQLQSELH
ncbi:MAG: LysM peptidoglycan-binding domain-containing protein [Chloroflexi bacterium]|nr:LysM peptidoglycan-binding domain-containing protein [Chloroflexota bacterium]